MAQVLLPDLGEGVTQATVSFWFIKEGAVVKENDDIVELTTDKAAFNLPSPCPGTLIKILKQEGDTVKIGDALAIIE
ncbi:MAG: lipoyl domain-containing protein [Candidatus Omnitrophica bacterium]|nr:lipoyl domain-containing protein [Candidatus Omnitrophota bacterium]